MRSGWFDCTEPSLTTSLQEKQGLQGVSALVRCGSSASLATSLQGKQGVQGARGRVRGGYRT